MRICALPFLLVLIMAAVLACLGIPPGFFSVAGLMLTFGLGELSCHEGSLSFSSPVFPSSFKAEYIADFQFCFYFNILRELFPVIFTAQPVLAQ
jgi:hypothetical protein